MNKPTIIIKQNITALDLQDVIDIVWDSLYAVTQEEVIEVLNKSGVKGQA